MNFWRSQLTTLQIAVLFVYSALLCLAFAGIFALNAWTLWRADLLEYVPDFGMAALLCVSSPLGMTVALLRFHSARRTNSGMSRFALFFALVAVVCGVLALRLTPFAFGRVAVAAFLLTFLFTEASVRISGITRSWFVAFAILLGSATLLVTFIEGLLVTQYLNARFSRTQKSEVLDFGDVVGGRTPGRLKANLDAPLLLGSGGSGRVISNALGFRNAHEMYLPAPEDEYRIILAGDSFAFGFRTDQTKFAGAILEHRLRETTGRNVRVYPAWTEDQNGFIHWLREYPDALDADLILHAVCLGNDLGTSFRGQLAEPEPELTLNAPIPARYLNAKRGPLDTNFFPGYEARNLREHYQLPLVLKTMFWPTPIFPGIAFAPEQPPLWSGQNDMGLFLKDQQWNEPLLQTFEANLKQIHVLRKGMPLRVLIFPQRFQQSEREWQTQEKYYGLDEASFDRDLPNRRIQEMCERNDWQCRDLLPAFRANGERLLHLPYDMHWNDAGNLLAGETIAEYLIDVVQ